MLVHACADGQIEVSPKSQTAAAGDQVQIQCNISIENQHGVVWEFKGNGSIPETLCNASGVTEKFAEKYDCQNSATTYTLLINHVSANDAGVYTCTEDGGRGPGKDSAILTVDLTSGINISLTV